VVGHVTDDGLIRVLDSGDLVAELPIALLTDEVPAYTLHGAPPDAEARRTTALRKRSSNPQEVLCRLLASPNLAARRPVFRQYDSTVQGNTVFGPGAAAAAVVRLDGTRCAGLALTTDCNPRYTRLDPRCGAQQAVAEAARNLACVGARPIAVTDCLNFGNPEKGHVAWQLVEAVEGLAEACRALDVPIVSGNVSLYNETAGQPIPPTPAVGMVGLLDDVSRAVRLAFPPGCRIVLLGPKPEQLSGGEYHPDGPFPWLDLPAERRLGELLRALAARRLIGSAQDVADGGLAVALAECCFAGCAGRGAGARVRRLSEAELFSEDQGRAVVSCCDEDVSTVLLLADEHHVPAEAIGWTGGDRLIVEGAIDATVDALRAIWEAGLT
jgi:phosphoribosylformylglycinamidine synthase